MMDTRERIHEQEEAIMRRMPEIPGMVFPPTSTSQRSSTTVAPQPASAQHKGIQQSTFNKATTLK
ncbi:hypothetical protein HK102_009884, partial [Quaeritorhiza haematococci]